MPTRPRGLRASRDPHHPQAPLRIPRSLAPVAWLLTAAGLFAACSPATDSGPTLDEQRARERAAAYFAQDNRAAALEALAPLLAGPDVQAEDLVRAAVVHRSQGSLEEAQAVLERALALDPDSAAVHYGLGQLALFDAELERAAGHLRRAHELEPGDVPTRLGLAMALEETDPDGARELYRGVHAEGLDQTGSFHLVAVFRWHRLCQQLGLQGEARPLMQEFQRLQERGFSVPSGEQLARGNLGDLRAPAPFAGQATAPGTPPRFGAARGILDGDAGFPGLAAQGTPWGTALSAVADFDNDGQLDVLSVGATGIGLALQNGDLSFVTNRVDGPARAAAPGGPAASRVLPFDVENDDDLDLALVRGSTVELWLATLHVPEEDEAAEGERAHLTWEAPAAPFFDAGDEILDLVPVDYDHDGDLDLACVGAFGLRLLRNDAAGVAGSFTDATEESGVPQGSFAWVRTEDFDGDQDVDLLLGGAEAPRLASNVRNGRFEEVREPLADLGPCAFPPVVRDLNGDGRADLAWFPDDDTIEAWHALPSGRFEAVGTTATPDRTGRPLAVDLDQNGALDLVWAHAGGWRALLSVGLGTAAVVDVEVEASGTPDAERASPDAERTWPDAKRTWIGDFDADLNLELVHLLPERVEVRDAEAAPGAGLLLSLRGVKDNRRAIGALVELRAGPTYQRVFWRGGTELLGVGGAGSLDWLRITWPNGVVQYDPRLDTGDRRVTNDPLEAFKQVEGLVGSCPFLYTWNGEEFEFISDVLGITPLGLPMAPGMLVPPDHDEYVLVLGEQLVPKDGVLEVQFTEELREVTYLDRVRLDVVDHPVGTEVYPEERFTFPPFPEAHTHSVREPLSPVRVLDDQGRDWTEALAAIDRERAHPFEPAPSQYLGLATPHTLEIAFDPVHTRDAERLRLLLTGWFYWTDASVNVAVARDPAWSFVPPLLSVPDGEGGWTEPGPPIGFPAGKSKTMVVDVTGVLDPRDPRLRLTSSLRLSWDAIRLAVDGDDAPLATTSLEPVSAHLWRRGFSAPLDDEGGTRPVRFDWEQLAPRPRWNPHPGLYTRLGETLPLVTEVDDRFVIMGSGEALTVRFDATELPELAPGMRRDYLLFLDGWAKDRDPNTVEALYVEPLPFHGMSAYPYGPDEHFPDTEATRAWRRDWNTRPAEPWLTEGPER